MLLSDLSKTVASTAVALFVQQLRPMSSTSQWRRSCAESAGLDDGKLNLHYRPVRRTIGASFADFLDRWVTRIKSGSMIEKHPDYWRPKDGGNWGRTFLDEQR